MKRRFLASIMALAITASGASMFTSATANAGWVQDDNNTWYYYNEDGSMVKDSWLYDAKDYKDWFHFDENGVLDTNKWIYDSYNNIYCYVDENGFKLKNIVKTFDDGLKYKFREDGSLWRWFCDTKTGKNYYIDNDNRRSTFEPEFFSNLDIDKDSDTKVQTTIELGNIKQVRTVGDIEYTLNIDLKKWDLYTTPEQIWHISNLFWNCYPKMYKRFVSDVYDKNCEITIAIENEDYSPAWCAEHRVHLFDRWLYDNPNDYDCLTHELAHSLQNRLEKNGWWSSWDGNFCGDSDYIENFADYCRYIYAYRDGYYNDEGGWNPDKVKIKEGDTECVNYNSIRFLVWLDYKFSDLSDKNKDIMVRFSDVCRNKKYMQKNWNDAWAEIFKGINGLNGRSIEDVWQQYLNDTDFSNARATVPRGHFGETSELLQRYNIREKLAR